MELSARKAQSYVDRIKKAQPDGLCGYESGRLLLVQTPEINGYQFAYSGLLHGYAIYGINGTHSHFIMGYNDKLAFLTESSDHIREFAHIGIIKRASTSSRIQNGAGLMR